jgi:hypothetical protein
MKTLDPIEHDVVEDRAADGVPAASPIDIGEAAGIGRLAPASFRYRRPVDAEHSAGSLIVASFELSAHKLVYSTAPSTPLRALIPCHKGILASCGFLQQKQREVIWQLRLDVSL